MLGYNKTHTIALVLLPWDLMANDLLLRSNRDLWSISIELPEVFGRSQKN